MGSTHWVVCKVCGKKFDASKKGGFYDGNRYTCKSCGKKLKARANALNTNALPSSTSRSQSWFKRNWKMVIGIVFFIGGLGNIGQDSEAALFGVIVGIVLVAWHIASRILEKKRAAAQIEEKRKEEMERERVCTRCGAVTRGTHCEYCGGKLDD